MPAGLTVQDQGGALVVRAVSGPMGYDEGLAAKRAVLAACAGQGRGLSSGALGRYAAGVWVFDGGCQ